MPCALALATLGAIAAPAAQAAWTDPGKLPMVHVDARGEAILAWDQRSSTSANPDGPEIAVAVLQAP
jgi:hypothetical protein